MHIPLIVKAFVHPRELPNNYDDRLVTSSFPSHDPVWKYMRRYLTINNWYDGEFVVTRDGRLSRSLQSRFSLFSEQLEGTDPDHRWEEANRIAMHVAALIVQDMLYYSKITDKSQEGLMCLSDALLVTHPNRTADGIPVIEHERIPNNPQQIIQFIQNRLASGTLKIDDEARATIRGALGLLETLSTRGDYPFLNDVGGLFAWHIIDTTYRRKHSSKYIEAIYLVDMHV
jgi:hypothetical protein